MKPAWKRYGLMIGALLVALAIREGVDPIIGRRGAFALFLIVTFLVGRYTDTRQAIVCLLLGLYPALLLGARNPYSRSQIVAAGFYLGLGAIIITLEWLQRRSADELRAFIDHAAALIYAKDREGKYLLVNRQFEEQFKRESGEIKGRNDFDIFPEPVANAILASDARVWTTGEAEEFDEVMPHNDGPHPYKSTKFPIRDPDGRMLAIGGIATDITQQKRMLQDLEAERRLLEDLIKKEEAANKILCYEIHDGIIQSTTAALMMLEAFRNRASIAADREPIDRIIDILRRALGEGRRVIRGLRPTILDDDGIDAALRELAEQFSADGLEVELQAEGNFHDLPDPVETAVYRVIQESLTNARKHSGSRKAVVRLERSNEHLDVQVRDSGGGFHVDKVPPAALGLRGIRERVRQTGGSCTIESAPGSGTTVSARFPVS